MIVSSPPFPYNPDILLMNRSFFLKIFHQNYSILYIYAVVLFPIFSLRYQPLLLPTHPDLLVRYPSYMGELFWRDCLLKGHYLCNIMSIMKYGITEKVRWQFHKTGNISQETLWVQIVTQEKIATIFLLSKNFRIIDIVSFTKRPAETTSFKFLFDLEWFCLPNSK